MNLSADCETSSMEVADVTYPIQAGSLSENQPAHVIRVGAALDHDEFVGEVAFLGSSGDAQADHD
jgi:hypothetical protein